jgi:hypothetical protein
MQVRIATIFFNEFGFEFYRHIEPLIFKVIVILSRLLPEATLGAEAMVEGDSFGMFCNVSGRAFVGSFLATLEV